MSFKWTKSICTIAVASVAATTLVSTPANAAGLVNGNFSNGLTGWNLIDSQVFLGTTNIGGCTSVDTQDYAAIRASASPPLTTTPTNDSAPVMDGTFVGEVSTTEAPPGQTTSLRLESNVTTANGYDVVHGPVAYSDRFSANPNQVMSLKWRAQGGSDNFAVVAYLLDESTCKQTELIDATGTTTAWATAQVAIPITSKNYRFVFVGGTFDYTGGQAAGAQLFIGDISSTASNPNAPVVSLNQDGPVTGKKPKQKVPLAGSTKKPKAWVKIYRAKKPGGKAVLVKKVRSTSEGVYSAKAPMGKNSKATFCAVVRKTVSESIVVTQTSRSGYMGRLSTRGDVVNKKSVRCPK